MKHYQRVNKYGRYRKMESSVANWGGIWRNALRVAFGGVNLFPLPVKPNDGLTIYASVGRKFDAMSEQVIPVTTTFHLRKSRAYRLLTESIIEEANNSIRPRLVDKRSPVPIIFNVVWRHTGGTGNFAKNFLVEAGGELWLLVKLKNRYNLFHGDKEILAVIPDHMFSSALDALYKFEQTGRGVWFPESRDQWVRENFPSKHPPWRMPQPSWYRHQARLPDNTREFVGVW
jgi:hypothetical protein